MFPPEDTPFAARLSSWLDWWFTPRWRALLTWVILACLGSELPNFIGGHLFGVVIQGPTDLFNRISPLKVPSYLGYTFTELLNDSLPYVWFEPFALRLSLPRSVAWLALRIAPVFILNYPSPLHSPIHG
jgi:hypothetical protein